MRLANFQDDFNGGTTSQDDKVSQKGSRRRTSLDYKARTLNNEPMTTTKPGKRKSRRPTPEEQQAAAAAMARSRTHPSRARGGSGPPPRKFELSDLDNMSQEEILQALYADPELAQSVAKMAEEMSAAEANGQPSTGAPVGARKGGRRSPTGSKQARKELSEYPDHMRELMDGGVPVVQWIILLVLLGAALYQLRKILMLPDAKDKGRGVRANKAAGGKKGAKKGATDRDVVENALRAIQVDTETQPPTKKAPPKVARKVAPTPKKKKKANANNGTAPKKQDTESAPTKETTGADDSDKAGLTVSLTAPIQTATTSAADDDGAGWQTVSKATDAKPAATEVKPPEGAQPTTAATQPPPGFKALATPEETPAAKENTPPHLNGSSEGKKKTKKKKAKAGQGSNQSEAQTSSEPSTAAAASAPTETKTTDNDEALAKKLQKEEENLAQGGAEEPVATDIWEEVTTRKRKGNKPETAA